MISISFVRHGESTDNLRAVWAGWKDAPLSNHGMNQAKACGGDFASIRLATVYTSPLDRAYTTAKAIVAAQAGPPPPFIVSPDLREQHFGVAEGESWVLTSDTGVDVQRKVFPVLHGRDTRFPEGESLDDLHHRANRALEELILPWVWDSANWGKEVHLVVVSHGLCISELIAALVKRDADGYGQGRDYRGLVNTGWTRVTVSAKDEDTASPLTTIDKSAPLEVRVTHVNQHQHLAGIKRQKGGIGSTAYDPKQQDIRDFFGGSVAKRQY